MKKVLNNFFYLLKYILFFISLGLTFYIILGMYSRIEKNYFNCINIFIPYLLILVIFCINFIRNQKVVINNIFYNITCVLVFSIIVLVSLRALFDRNMILNQIMGYNINFSYFSDFLVFMKIMLYGLFFGNIFLLISDLPIKEDTKDNVKDNIFEDDSNIEVL